MKEVQRIEEMAVVQPFKSDWASPVVMVPKTDGTERFCVDFRKVNSISKFNAYPVARIDDIIDRSLMMDHILQGTEEFLAALMDDIIIFSET